VVIAKNKNLNDELIRVALQVVSRHYLHIMLISRGTLVFVFFTSDVLQVVSSCIDAKDGI
jgi:hypothetical protein